MRQEGKETMSVTFNGTKTDPTREYPRIVRTEDERAEDSVGFNLANGNARAFLQFLQVPTANAEDGLYGSLPMADMVRLVQKARASFDYRVDALCREPLDAKGVRGPRIIVGGIGPEYFERRLAEFEALLAEWMLLGADGVSWG